MTEERVLPGYADGDTSDNVSVNLSQKALRQLNNKGDISGSRAGQSADNNNSCGAKAA
jgi:hypothetical protein